MKREETEKQRERERERDEKWMPLKDTHTQ